MVAGILQRFHRLPIQGVRISGADRTITETGLTEAAAADTAAEHFQIGSVVDNFRGRNNGVGGIIGFVQILDDALDNPIRRTLCTFSIRSREKLSARRDGSERLIFFCSQ